MKKYVSFFTFILLTLFTIQASNAAIPLDQSIAPMLQKVVPAVVNIKAQIKITDYATIQALQKRQKNLNNKDNNANNNNDNNETPKELPDNLTSIGSGVIIDAKKGYIVTNAHVISDATSITITLGDGRHFTAKIIGADKPSDVALLQINAPKLTAISLNYAQTLKVGDFVAAIGNPFGLSQSVTSGIVSALGRTTLGIENYENFIQTDAPINPGNSGGALINMKGELVGINTAILAPDRGNIGIGFAIPANMVRSVVEQLIEYGNVKRGILGIGAQDMTPELANAFDLPNTRGAAVTQVLVNSPAAQAGIQAGDIITKINHIAINNNSDVFNTIGFLRVNSKVDIQLLRQKKPITVKVTLTDLSVRKKMMEKTDAFLYGVSLKNFTLFSPVHGNIKAVAVINVEQDTNAWHADLRPGDVITSIDQEKITDVEQLMAIVQKHADQKQILANILRGPMASFIVITKEG